MKAEREKFESWVVRDVKKACPAIKLDECALHTETDLYINTGRCNEQGKYEMDFSVSFMSWFTDADGNEVYSDMSDGFEIELSDRDKAYIKKLVAIKVIDILI